MSETIEGRFYRYDGADDADSAIRMPVNQLEASITNMTLGELIIRFEKFTENPESGAAMYPWADRFVMGYPLASWQRQPRWDTEQKVRFIESIWSGVDIGSYMVNELYEFVKNGAGGTYFRELSDILIDGQQRLTAIQGYLLNEFGVPDASGQVRFWRELPKVERRRFSSCHFARAHLRSWDETLLRKAHDLREFGGTPHTEEERALK